MAISPPENRLWWKEPIERVELGWIVIAFLWGLFMFIFMIAWHFIGGRTCRRKPTRAPGAFEAKVVSFAEQFRVGEDGATGVPVVRPRPAGRLPAGAAVGWWPILEAQKRARLPDPPVDAHWQHGFSLQPPTSTSRCIRLRADHHADADRGRRVQGRLQRMLRHQPSHDDRPDPRRRIGQGRP